MLPVVERVVRYAHAAYVDLRLFLTGKSDPTLPPWRLRFVGGGDFRTIGEHLLQLTVSRGKITPESRILDVGSGSGRLALPLTGYLRGGTYAGFDVVKPAVRWCRRHITSGHPNFRFDHVALRNSDYSARGKSAAEFHFPYDDASFDCVVAYSVFTHLQGDEIRNYLRQSHRVLVPGGRLVATFFLFSDDSAPAEQFPHDDGAIRFARKSNPAFAVAVRQSVLEAWLREIGFRDIVIEPGYWTGRAGSPEYQDLVTCTK